MTLTAASQRPNRSFGFLRTFFALILREMATSYGRSAGGYIWAVLQPVAAIALLSFAFALFLNAPSLGTQFPLFYATGYLPFVLFQEVSAKITQAIRFSKSLLSFGAVTWIDLLLARFVLNVMTHLVVFVIVIAGLAVVFGDVQVPDYPTVLNGLAMAAALAFGVGTLNCFLITVFPLWEHVWNVATRPLFIASGVFFILEDTPSEFRDILWFNPLFHVTGEVRRGIYPTYVGDYISSAYVYAVAIGLTLAGLALIRAFQNRVLDA